MGLSSVRVAVLGGGGFVGRNVCNALEAGGATVEVFSRTTGCDLLDLHTAANKLHSFRPAWIVNCAAEVGSVNYVYDFAADVLDLNMRMILNVYKAAQQMREVVILNPVANCAYPGSLDLYSEDQFANGPLHPSVMSYGATRRQMVYASYCYFRQYGLRSVNLIVPNMYGPHDSTNPNKTHALNALIIKFVNAVNHQCGEIEVWGTGNPIREWLFAKDFAKAVCEVIGDRRIFQDPINIAQNEGHSVKQLVETIANLVDYKGDIFYNTRYQDGSPKKVMDNTKFKAAFPEFQFTELERGIRETIEYYRRIL